MHTREVLALLAQLDYVAYGVLILFYTNTTLIAWFMRVPTVTQLETLSVQYNFKIDSLFVQIVCRLMQNLLGMFRI